MATPAPAREKLAILSLAKWVRQRPETFLGPVAPAAELRWLVSWRDAPLPQRPVTSLPERELNRLKKQEVLQTLAPTEKKTGARSKADKEAPVATECAETATAATAATADTAAPSRSGRQLVTARRLLIELSPAAEKCVDEILQNAADRQHKDAMMKKIEVWVDEATGVIRVRNDGCGMDTNEPDAAANPDAPKGERWPTILFTRIMAGGNFVKADDVAQYQGGRNGIGAKGTNICSRSFKVTVGDAVNHRHFVQHWYDGMSRTDGPKLKSYANKTGFVEVEFELDYAFFGMPNCTPAFAAAVRSRVWELACTSNVTVYLDGAKLPLRTVTQFASLFGESAGSPLRSTLEHKGRVVWDVSIVPATPDTADVLAFVNGMRCPRGTHVNRLMSEMASGLQAAVAKKVKGGTDMCVTPTDVKKAVFAVLSVWIDAPAFASQTKTKLDTPCSKYGWAWSPDEDFVRRLSAMCAATIAQNITTTNDAAVLREVNATNRSPRVEKYEPAGRAGKPDTDACLVLCEGDSAKALAMAGRSAVGSDKLGVFPLKGKPFNARDERPARVAENKTLAQVAQILGLQYGTVYDATSVRRLRYRHVWLLADQDADGGHIVGLVVNWVEAMWPSVLKLWPDFLVRFATPIVMARGGSRDQPVPFLSLSEFRAWLRQDPSRVAAYSFTYHKGLAGHSQEDGRAFFRQHARSSVVLKYEGKPDADMLDVLFGKKCAEERRALLEAYDEDTCVDYSLTHVPIREFLVRETLHYSHDHNIRDIPAIDGLKRTQRKLLWACLKLKPRRQPLAQLAMSCAKMARYHHGDASLYQTMVAMAQAHVGSNNVNVLACMSQMGSRLTKRDVHGSPRYLSTGLVPIASALFRPEDDPVLVYRVEDGKHQVEPLHMLPVLPLDLVNGCNGLGTGWRTNIPPFHVHDLSRAFRAWIERRADWRAVANQLRPWFDGFTGVVEVGDNNASWSTVGLYTVTAGKKAGTSTVTIYELPVGAWTDDYEEEVLVGSTLVTAYTKDHTDARVRFELVCDDEQLQPLMAEVAPAFAPDDRNHALSCDAQIEADARAVRSARYPALEAALKLKRTHRWNEMHRFDPKGRIIHYPSLADIIDEYGKVRLEGYEARLRFQSQELQRQLRHAENQHRFVQEVVDGTMPVRHASKRAWWALLSASNYTSEEALQPQAPATLSDLPDLGTKSAGNDEEQDDDLAEAQAEEPEDEVEPAGGGATFSYLTSMSAERLCEDQSRKLARRIAQLRTQLEELASMTAANLWIKDLENLERVYDAFVKDRRAANQVNSKPAKTKGMPLAKTPVKRARA